MLRPFLSRSPSHSNRSSIFPPTISLFPADHLSSSLRLLTPIGWQSLSLWQPQLILSAEARKRKITMSFMKGDLFTKTRKLVKGLAKAKPLWLKAMEEAPPVTFPRTDGKVEKITLPEDIYIKKFFKKHPDSKYEDAIRFSGFDPPPARVFGWRVLDLKGQGVSEEDAMAVADMEYRAEKKAKKLAYRRLKQIARLQGEKPPPNPYPSAIKEIQAEERKYVRERFQNPEILKIVQKMKEEKAVRMQDRWGSGGGGGGGS